jgi:hypothetical protein
MNRDLAEIDHRSRTYSLTNGRIMADFVLGRRGITRDEIEAWTRDLPLALLVAGQMLLAVAHQVAHGASEVGAGSGGAGTRHGRRLPDPTDRIGRI